MVPKSPGKSGPREEVQASVIAKVLRALRVSQQQVVSPERVLLAKPLVPKSVLKGEGEQTKATGLPIWEMMGSRLRDVPLSFFGL